MWSVWSERVDVYLGAGLVLVQRPGVPLWTFEPPATLPLADVLRHVNQALDRASAKPWRLRVHLSATLSPPVAFAVPAGVSRYQELMAIAQASAALAWAMPPERAAVVVCSLDRQHRGLAAALLGGTQQQIAQWAQGHSGRLVSLQPLWVAATQARACHERTTQNVAVLEPDALTVLQLGTTQVRPTRRLSTGGRRRGRRLKRLEWSWPLAKIRHQARGRLVLLLGKRNGASCHEAGAD